MSSAPRSLLWPTLATAVALAILVALGTWQLHRLQWKNSLIDMVETRVAAEPLPVPPAAAWSNLDLDALEYRPVTATGTFDHDAEMHVFTHLTEPRGRHAGPGFWVITPLVLPGGTVMVNRGFVPRELADPVTRSRGQVAGEVSVTGLLRKPERQGWFVPENEPDRNIWFYRDLAAMAAVSGHADAAPFLLDELENAVPGGLPQAGETRLRFRNNHLQYAGTWYGLALCLIGVYIAFWIAHRQRTQAATHG